MPINVNEMMELLSRVSEVRGMKAAIKHSGYGALAAGTGAFLGGLMGGPVGIAVGGTVGGIVGARMGAGKFKPVPQIILELSPREQQQLYHKVHVLVRHLDRADLATITTLVMTNVDIQNHLVRVLASFLTKEIGAQIQYGK